MNPLRIAFTLLAIALVGHSTARAQGPLPSWNDGPAKQAIVDFVRATTETGRPEVRAAGGAHRHLRPGRHALGRAPDVHAGDVLPGARPALVEKKPELKNVEPFKTVLSGNREAMAKLSDEGP